jgi:hypothetical protein
MAANTRRRPARGRKTVIAAIALATTAGAGCATEADPDEALVLIGGESLDPAFVSSVAQRSLAESYRYESDISMRMGVAGESLEIEGTFMSGAHSGDRTSTMLDMGLMFDQLDTQVGGEPMPPVLADADLTMESIIDGSTLYIRAPMFGALRDMAGGDLPDDPALGPAGALADLEDWGRVDLAALGDEVGMSEVGQAVGMDPSSDPAVLLELVAGADDVRPLGTDEVRGDQVTGLAAEISMRDMLEVQGVDPAEMTEQMEATAPPDADFIDDFMDDMLDTELPVEVWVDDAGYVRRVAFDIDFREFIEDAGLGDDLDADVFAAFSVGTTTDYFDYGDDITIDVPADAPDITDDFLELYEFSQDAA